MKETPKKGVAVHLFERFVPGGNCSSLWKSIDRSDREGWWHAFRDRALWSGVSYRRILKYTS